MESKANKIISEKIEEEDLTCQPTELNKADVKGHCRSGADKVFQEGIQSRTKEILELIQAGIRDRKQLYKVSVIDQFTDGGYIMALESLSEALRDEVAVER